MRIEPYIRHYVAAGVFDFAVVSCFVLSPFYMMDFLGGGPAMLGVVTGAQWGLYVVACLLSGPYVTRARNGLIWAIAGAGGFAILFPLSVAVKDAWFFGILSATAYGCTGLFWPAMQAWIGAIPDPDLRRRRMGFYNLSWTLGLTLAPLVAGPLYAFDYRLVIALIGAAGLGAVGLVAALPHEKDHFGEASAGLLETRASHDRASEAHLYMAWCSILVGCMLVSAFASIFTKRMDELVDANALVVWGGPGAVPLHREAIYYFAKLSFVLYASRALASVLMGLTHVWQHRFSFLAGLQVVAAAAFWAMAQSASLAILAACCVVVGFCAGACFFASQSYSVVDPALKHRRLTVHEAMIGVGSVVGAIGYGLLAECLGTPWPFAATPLFIAVGLAIQAALLRYGHRRQQRPRLAEEQP